MFCPASFDQWLTTIMQHLPQLSKPQARVLALWSLGMVLARSCALRAGNPLLANGRQRQEQTVRQPLRDWYYDVGRKRGAQRQVLPVETCFAPVLGWVVSWWHGPPLALAVDATALGTHFVGLAVSVVYRGGAIPVAWVVLPANTQQAWRRAWLRLLRRLRPAVPCHGTGMGLAARGLYAPWLLRRIGRLGWHPFLRINTGGTLRPAGPAAFQPLQTCVPRPGTRWRGRGMAFQQAGRQLVCPLLALWEDGDKAPWLLLTDLPPAASEAAWYGLRAWSEHGFQLTKREGWVVLLVALLRHDPWPQGH
jgi:hypothetical protein